MTAHTIVLSALCLLVRPEFIPDDRWLMMATPLIRLLAAADANREGAALLAVTDDCAPMTAQIGSYHHLVGWTVIVGDGGGINPMRMARLSHHPRRLSRCVDGDDEFMHLVRYTLTPLINWMIGIITAAKNGPTSGEVPEAWNLMP